MCTDIINGTRKKISVINAITRELIHFDRIQDLQLNRSSRLEMTMKERIESQTTDQTTKIIPIQSQFDGDSNFVGQLTSLDLRILEDENV